MDRPHDNLHSSRFGRVWTPVHPLLVRLQRGTAAGLLRKYVMGEGMEKRGGSLNNNNHHVNFSPSQPLGTT